MDRNQTESAKPPYEPSRAWTTYSRDGNAADETRRAQRRECAMLPAPAPTAAQLAYARGGPIRLWEWLLELDARLAAAEARIELLESK